MRRSPSVIDFSKNEEKTTFGFAARSIRLQGLPPAVPLPGDAQSIAE